MNSWILVYDFAQETLPWAAAAPAGIVAVAALIIALALRSQPGVGKRVLYIGCLIMAVSTALLFAWRTVELYTLSQDLQEARRHGSETIVEGDLIRMDVLSRTSRRLWIAGQSFDVGDRLGYEPSDWVMRVGQRYRVSFVEVGDYRYVVRVEAQR